MSYVSVYVTCPDEESARRIANAVVERRLVACANMLPGMTSLYRWEGRLEEAREVVMFLKTRRDKVEEVVRAVSELHPHEVPCVVALPLVAGHGRYLAWVDAEVQ